MTSMRLLAIFMLLLLAHNSNSARMRENSTAVLTKFLTRVNQHLATLYNREVFANWQLEIKGSNDLYARLRSEMASEEIINYLRNIASKRRKFKRLNMGNAELNRELSKIPDLGYEALSQNELKLMYIATANMDDIYKETKLCSYNDALQCNLTLIPTVQNILHDSQNVTEIEYYWLEWRRKTGMAGRKDFTAFIELFRKAAQLNDYRNSSDYWYKHLEENSTQIAAMLDNFMLRLRPLFLQFHAHVRGALRKRYGEQLIPRDKPYPQQLAEIFIGDAFRSANTKWHIEFPYPHVAMPNLTAALQRRGLNNTQRIFWNVVEYFRSLGMPLLEDNFWAKNARPNADLDKERCWHKSWKYYGMKRMNFSYCPLMDEERFMNMFEALSDVYYHRAYAKQPTLYAEEPFPNFSDAVAKMFALSASSPRYLEKLKLYEKGSVSKELRINRLYWQGLRTIFLLPVFYVLDRYRVDVLDERLTIPDNCVYWNLTDTYTGAEPPVMRSNEDFDALAKLLTGVDDEYTSEILRIVLQYQLYKHFCEQTGQYRVDDPNLPLDLCDLSNQREVAPHVLEAMSLGSSKSYKDILLVMTGESSIELDGLLTYYQPLYDWLVEENRKNDVEVGWMPSTKCKPPAGSNAAFKSSHTN